MTVAPQIQGSDVNIAPVPYQNVTAASAITISGGSVWLNGTTLAVSLAAPTILQNGQTLTVYSENASAHVLTVTGGTFNGGANNTGTYGGAIGDGVTLQAVSGEWFILSNTNVSLSSV